MEFLKQYAGRYAKVPTERLATVTEFNDGRFGLVSAYTDSSTIKTVLLTGWAIKTLSNTVLMQTINGDFVENWNDEFLTSGQSVNGNAQIVVNDLIRNNCLIYENNLFCARFANHLTTEQRKELFLLQYRLEKRNKALQDTSLLSNLEVSYPIGYSNFKDKLNTLYVEEKNRTALGFVISTSLIVKAVVIVAVAYFAYKYFLDESKEDVKFSNRLTKIIAEKLTKEEQELLYKETNRILTKKAILSKIGAYAGMAKNAILVAVGGFALFKAIEYYNNNQQKVF